MSLRRDNLNRWTSLLVLLAIFATSMIRAAHHHGEGCCGHHHGEIAAEASVDEGVHSCCSCGHSHHHHERPAPVQDSEESDHEGDDENPSPCDGSGDDCTVCALLDLSEAGDLETYVAIVTVTSVQWTAQAVLADPVPRIREYAAPSRAPPVLS